MIRHATARLGWLLIFVPVYFAGVAPTLAQSRAQATHDQATPEQVASIVPAALISPTASMPMPEPFDLMAAPVSGGELLNKWNGVVAGLRAESDILAHCRDGSAACPEPAQKFLAMIAAGRAQDGRARIGIINRAVNMAIRPQSDLAQWGVIDHWSTPLVTLASGRGDCEDYAIAKYVALTEAGVAADDVRLVIVHDLAAGEDHAVVTVRLEGKWLVLDNRRLLLRDANEFTGAVPLFVLDFAGVRQFTPGIIAGGRAADAAPAALPAAN
jgi:predicted transglutaminase-like cysteine proteinase